MGTMSRVARRRSSRGIHHILVQGPRGQKVFAEDTDKLRYLETIQKYHREGKVRLYAYCILENSAHILIEEAEDDVSRFMRRVGISYVRWYNRQRGREGALFRDRYASQPVNDEAECMRMIRFIHQQPVRLGLARRMSEYPWSSYGEYLVSTYRVDRGELLGLLGDWNYERYMKNSWRDLYLRERPPYYQKTDEEALRLIQLRMNGRRVEELRTMKIEERNELLRQMRYDDGISIAQLSRVTSIGRGTIQRIRQREKDEGEEE